MAPLTSAGLPDRIEDVAALEDLLSRPSQALIDDLAALDGDIIILGVGGKVGPCLARMAKRAAPHKRIVGVARFSDPAVKRQLEDWDVETLACDLFIAIGSSLVVYPAAGFPIMAKQNGSSMVILNREPTDLDSHADLVINGEIGPTLGDAVAVN